MQKITPCLWFDNNIEEAVKYYTSVFKNSKVISTTYYGEGMHLPKGTVLTIMFELNGQEFMALNGGPAFKFTEAVSFMINCDTQQEIDEYWEKLTSDGGQELECSWVKDKFGMSWQIVPASLGKMMKDSQKFDRVIHAVMKMKKLDIKTLEQAYAGK